MIKKYSKSYGDMWAFKNSLIDDNDAIVGRDNATRKFYMEQPLRDGCKLCGGVGKSWKFNAHGVEYWVCDACGHLNGSYQDTEAFCSKLYEDGDTSYSADYSDTSIDRYNDRIEAIYLPKARFLCEVLSSEHIDCRSIKVLDIGAGTGHFIGALEQMGIDAVGVEVDRYQVEHGNKFLAKNKIQYVGSENIVQRIKESTESCISFIYCLEHIINLNEILDAVSENKNIEYIFFSVPMLSYSVIAGACDDDVADRILAGGEHSHLFTNESIRYLIDRYGWQKLGEWRFGADVSDFIRMIVQKLRRNGNEILSDLFVEKIGRVMDEIQAVIDRQELCSDTHIVIKKNQ